MWTLAQALIVVRALQPYTRKYGYHLTLGGGVLNKGASDKDLDLYFLPMGGFDATKRSDPTQMLEFLQRLWGASTELAGSMSDGYGKRIKSHYKHAIKFTRHQSDVKQRIDCFIF